MTRLTVLTALEIVALGVALVLYLERIVSSLERIGGPADSSASGSSTLAKVRWGVQAIEKESSHLGPQVTQLNGGLLLLAEKLAVVEGQLGRAAAALAGEEEA